MKEEQFYDKLSKKSNFHHFFIVDGLKIIHEGNGLMSFNVAEYVNKSYSSSKNLSLSNEN